MNRRVLDRKRSWRRPGGRRFLEIRERYVGVKERWAGLRQMIDFQRASKESECIEDLWIRSTDKDSQVRKLKLGTKNKHTEIKRLSRNHKLKRASLGARKWLYSCYPWKMRLNECHFPKAATSSRFRALASLNKPRGLTLVLGKDSADHGEGSQAVEAMF